MHGPSYGDVFNLNFDRGYEETIAVTDLVRTGPNHFPHFEVIAIHGETVWVKNIDTGADGFALLSQCRKINPALAVAAE